MADDEIEWLDQPALPARSENMPIRRSRRPPVLVISALAVIATVVGVLVTHRGDPQPRSQTSESSRPSAVTEAAEAPSATVGSLILIPDPSPGLLRAVAENFHGAKLRTIGACDDDGGSYEFVLRSLTIHIDVGCVLARQRIDSRDPNQIVVSGHNVRVLINSPRNTINARDYVAAKRLVADRRVASS